MPCPVDRVDLGLELVHAAAGSPRYPRPMVRGDGDERLLAQILSQLEAGQFRTAKRLAGRPRQHPYRGVGALADDRWAWLHELVPAAGWLPDPVVRALVDGIRADDLAAAIPALTDFSRTDPRAPHAAETLRWRAPQIYLVVGRAMPAPVALAPPAPRLPARRAGLGIWVVLGILVTLRAACVAG